MRYWVLALILLTLGAPVMAQCGGLGDWDWDFGDLCEGMSCPEDGNECTHAEILD